MSCQFRHDDAAYVLGALEPAERAAFEAHLPGCPGCAASVRGLGGIPGILAHAPIEELLDEPHEDVPVQVLPNVVHRVRAERRRHRWRTTLVAAAATVLLAAGTVVVVQVWNPSEATMTYPAQLAPVIEVDVWGEADMTERTEGTEIRLVCHSKPSDGDDADDGDGSYGDYAYRLQVTNVDGDTDIAGSWIGDPDGDSRVVLFTRWKPAAITSLEVQDIDGHAVMRWDRDE